MPIFNQKEIDAISDGLKRAALHSKKLPESKIVAWFFNASDGPQFWIGFPSMLMGWQPLYLTPAHKEQKPVAIWDSTASGIICLIEHKHIYRDDLDWQYLYLARADVD